MFENWEDIRKYREEKGVTREELGKKMRLSAGRIAYLEAGDFSDADPVIVRLQLKNYAQHLGIAYTEILALSGLKEEKTPETPQAGTQKLNIKKTHSYKGRRKGPGKGLIYTLVVLGAAAMIFGLNILFRNIDTGEDLYEMTRRQSLALANDSAYLHDSTLFKPVLPQAVNATEVRDITENMELYAELDIRFPVKVDLFPAERIPYRCEPDNGIPSEDLIMENTPASLTLRRSGRFIFYHTEDTRFVFDGLSLRDPGIRRVVIDIHESGRARIYLRREHAGKS